MSKLRKLPAFLTGVLSKLRKLPASPKGHRGFPLLLLLCFVFLISSLSFAGEYVLVEGREFEREFAAWVGVPYAVALANGTVALQLAVSCLGRDLRQYLVGY